jgi:hypothetical protein
LGKNDLFAYLQEWFGHLIEIRNFGWEEGKIGSGQGFSFWGRSGNIGWV